MSVINVYFYILETYEYAKYIYMTYLFSGFPGSRDVYSTRREGKTTSKGWVSNYITLGILLLIMLRVILYNYLSYCTWISQKK